MKLAIITQYYKPEMGAPQNRLSEMAIGLINKGWKIDIITALPNYPTGKIFKDYSRKFFSKEMIDTISVRRHWLYASNSKKSFPRVISMLSFSFTVLFSIPFFIRQRFDFIVIESPPLTLGFTGYIISRLSGSKMILNISDLWPQSAKELGAISDGVLYRQLVKLEKFLYKKSFICMGQSEEIVNHIKSHGSTRPYLFRNGVDPKRFQNTKDNIIYTKLKIVYTGLLGVAQGIYGICKNVNFEQLNAEFHIYGDGSEKSEIEQYLSANEVTGIFYHGSVAREQIPSILSKYNVTLIALVMNIQGAVPSKIYESMAAGLPILFSGNGEGRSIIESFNLGWTSDAGDYGKLKQNILGIQQNSDDFQQIKDNCINAATVHFNRPRQIEELHKYLASLL